MTQLDPSFTQTAFDPDHLIAGSKHLITRTVNLVDNQGVGALQRGTILGRDSGSYAIVHETGSYPATTARAILAKDADPSGGAVEALVYMEGEFNIDRVFTGGTVTPEQCREPLEDVGIHMKEPVSAV